VGTLFFLSKLSEQDFTAENGKEKNQLLIQEVEGLKCSC